jgi:hypothetical protein
MNTVIKALVLTFGIASFGSAHAFTVAPLSKAQEKTARQDIKAQLPPGSAVKSIKFGYGPTPPGFIGSGLEHATVTLRSGAQLRYNVSPGLNGGVNVWK